MAEVLTTSVSTVRTLEIHSHEAPQMSSHKGAYQ